jgi:hypothetical protein
MKSSFQEDEEVADDFGRAGGALRGRFREESGMAFVNC